MVWANFGLLALGAALLSLPIILHFLMQPKPKIIEFPALQFVKKRELTNKSRMRLQHVVLMLLRCLLIGLMAAALAGPAVASRQFGQWVILGAVVLSALVVAFALLMSWFTRRQKNTTLTSILGILLLGHLFYLAWAGIQLSRSESAQLIGDSAAPISALILIDNSVRMSYQQQNKTNLDRAKEMGQWLIEQFPADSQTCVISSSSDAPFYSVDLGAASHLIDNLDIEFLSVPIPKRLASGLRLLEEGDHERKEVYIVTDLTAKSWQADEDGLRKLVELSPDLSMFVVDVGQASVTNFALSPVTLNRDTLTENSGLRLKTNVHRNGAAAQRTIRLQIERPDNNRPVVRNGEVVLSDQKFERDQVLDLRANGSAAVEFSFSERLPIGDYHATIELIGEDAMAYDNARYFTFTVRPTWNVLVVTGEGVTPDNLTEAIAGDPERSMFECQVVTQSGLPDQLEEFDAIIILDPDPTFSESTWNILGEYVEAGHGLGIFLGANSADGAFGHENFRSSASSKLLTGFLDRQWRRPDADLFLSPDNLSHPVFAAFREWETAVPWNQFPIFIHWGIEPDKLWEQFPTRVFLRFGNGMPAVIERQLGQGVVTVMTTPITEVAQIEGRGPWNELFFGNCFPSWLLVRQISEYLVDNQADRLNLKVGEIASLKNDIRKFPATYRIFTPKTAGTPEKISSVDDRVKYRFTDSPGHYRLKGKLDRTYLRGFSVNLQDGQTDLTRVLPEDLDNVLGAKNFQLATGKDEIQRQQGQTRRGQEFYPLLLMLLIVVLAVEYLMANRFYS